MELIRQLRTSYLGNIQAHLKMVLDWGCICKKIVEAHGGRMWVGNNSAGRGVTFTFSLSVYFV